ncbi:hypothetical protein [Trichlorobacter lovleyi]|uniref:hypothetical protein n=1 Tax=Trichlorobacter lovleyi TaxID=313985 RepID=UPI003D111B1A
MKTAVFFVCILVLSVSDRTFAAEENLMQGVGKGLIVGGMAPGAGRVGLAGVVIDVLGGVLGQISIDKKSPEYKASMEKSWSMFARMEVFKRYKGLLGPTPNTTPDLIKTQSEAYCSALDKTAATGGYMLISRKDFEESPFQKIMPDDFLPEGEGDIKYKLSKNPVDNCVAELVAAGERMVAMEKKKAAKE